MEATEVCRGTAELPETAEIEALIESCIETGALGGPKLENASQRLSKLVKRYCEAPRLLEPLASRLLPKLAKQVFRPEAKKAEARAALLYMYHLMRARGYKRAVVHLPHEIMDLIPVLEFLESEDAHDNDNWQCRFSLLLWLSIIVMMPFHMSRLDAFSSASHSGEKDEKRKTVMSRIFDICKTYSSVSDACSEAGAFLTSKFLTRSDVLEVYLKEFFTWAQKQNSDFQDEDQINYGVVASVATILKHGKREDLLCYTDDLFSWIVKQNYENSKSITVRKYGIKIVQRIALILLKPRLASWRYIREKSSLALNLQTGNNGKMQNVNQNNADANNEDENMDNNDDQDIPEQIEEIIEHLFIGLQDGDNIVRWSAAKGIGRVSARLNCSAAKDIITGIMGLFNRHEGDGAWHGGCLALAELGRRGLLLKCHLENAVSVVLLALQYEEIRGHTPTGRHVRDAACYVCWAFVRAYTEDLTPYINDLIIGLMTTAVFDREINCRLAARAAFEESIGRLQIVNAENLSILTADEFFLNSTKRAFTGAASYVTSVNKKFIKPLIDHLVTKKVDHWDINIRELASKSLHLLAERDPAYMAEQILPILLEKTSSTDLNTRHGSILAIGEVIYGLYLNGYSKISNDIFEGIQNIVPILKAKYQFRGLGGELMRQACCVCIEKLALSKIKYHNQPIIDEWLNLIEECLMHEVIIIRSKAAPALSAVFNEYLNDNIECDDGLKGIESIKQSSDQLTQKNLAEKRKDLLTKYCQQLAACGANGLQIRMGYSLAIGGLPRFALEEFLPLVLTSLIDCTKITDQSSKWSESRRDAIKGLTNACKTVGVKKIESSSNMDVRVVFDCFLRCLTEYTIEMRGDIGAWVREASIAGLLSLCKQCAEEDLSIFNEELVTKVMVGIAQQAVEKIDRTRAHAGKAFTALVYCKPVIPFIPKHEELLNIFPPNLKNNDESPSTNEAIYKTEEEDPQAKSAVLWLFPEYTMPLFVKLLNWDVYRYGIILGLTVSAGEMTESLVKHSTSTLFSYLTPIQDDRDMLIGICDTVIKVFSDNHEVDRMMTPMFKFLDRLCSSGCVSVILEDPSCTFAEDILHHIKIEMKNCRNIYKMLDCISVLCQLIQAGGGTCNKSLAKLLICICYMDKYVRKATATKLYDALLIYGESTISPDNMDEIMTILAETNWELEVAELRPIRNRLSELMDIPPPVLVKKS